MKIGFIGLDAMGLPMFINLIHAGHTLTVWNRNAAATKSAVDIGPSQPSEAE